MLKRDIVFRGKRLDNGPWVEGSLTVDCHGNCRIWQHLKVLMVVGFQYFDVDPETVGQFTGITDNNGTKIFEGDILKEQYGAYERIYDVFWKEDYFAFCAKYKDDSYYLDEIAPSHCIVIGNIYDNKELLK